MEWRLWLLIFLLLETATEGAVADRRGSVEAQRTPRSQKPINEHAIHRPVAAQESFVPIGTERCAFNHQPEVVVGLVFHSLNAKHKAVPSYVRIPLRQRLQPGSLSGLPHRPKTARIYSSQITSRSRSSQNVICHAYPVLSPEELSMRGRHRRFRRSGVDSVWFRIGDGEVDFTDPKKMWFLAGRDVESYECF